MSRAAESVEVLVIGGGIMGSSIAYHLARQGRSVLVVERNEVVVEPAGSWASAGGICLQGQEPAEVALARAAGERWPTLAEELEADLHYRQGGNLLLAESEVEAEQVQTFVQRQHELISVPSTGSGKDLAPAATRGKVDLTNSSRSSANAPEFADVSFLDREAVFSLVPGLGEQVVAGSFSASSGQADPRLTTAAFANAAKRHGARYWTGTACLALQRVGDRVVGAQTTQGFVQAEQVVLAAGAWSGELTGSVGIQLPVRTRVLQVLLSTPAPSGVLLPVLHAVGRALTLKQLTDDTFLLGGGWSGDVTPDGRSYTLREVSRRGNWQTACELFPPVRQQQPMRAWGGLQAQTLDDLPLIGSFSELEGLTLALGSWYGFTIAPAVGSLVAEQLAGRPTPELDPLTPDRIARFDPARVAAFLAEPS